MKKLVEKHNNDVPSLLTTIASYLSRKTKFFVDKSDAEWQKLLCDIFMDQISKAETKRKTIEVAEKRRQEIIIKMEEIRSEFEKNKRELDELNETLEITGEDPPIELVETTKDENTVPKDILKSNTNKIKQTKTNTESSNKVSEKKRTHFISAYEIWFDEHREQIKKDNPTFTLIEVTKRANQLWLNLKDTNEWDEKAVRANATRNDRRNTKKGGADDSNSSNKKGSSSEKARRLTQV